MKRSGTKMMDSATTNPDRARYCPAAEAVVMAVWEASQLTIMKPPRTKSQFVPSIADAMGAARPLENRNASIPVNPRIANRR
jgi:hypothetical protein